MRSGLPDITIICTLAALGRLALFTGGIGGDDLAYSSLAREILNTGYPNVGSNVFASRPLFVGPIAGSIAVFGWTELGLILPVLIASVWGIGCTYLLGRLLSGRRAGLIAAVTLALFPLDLVYATTTTNDIVGSAMLATAALLSLLAVSSALNTKTRAASVFGVGGGIVAGAAPAAKLSFVLGWTPFALIIAAIVAVHRRVWIAAWSLLLGWAGSQLATMAFFWQTSGSALANYSVELNFNRAFMAEPYLTGRADALLAYPFWAFGIRPAFPDNDRFFPYGLFFPLVIVAIVTVLCCRPRQTWFLVVWWSTILVLLEFWPLQLFPSYIPIHRLPRFLHLAAVPGALLVGSACSMSIARGGAMRVSAVALWSIYMLHSLCSSLVAVQRNQDSMKDLRFGAEISSRFQGPVVTDGEMRGYLMFRRGFRGIDKLQKVVGAQVKVPAGAMVLVGGGRRIDMDPAWTARRTPAHVPDDWVVLAAMPGGPRPWRAARGNVYLAVSPAKLQAVGYEAGIGPGSCGTSSKWRLVDVVDVGDPMSEVSHIYRIEGQTYLRDLMLLSEQGAELEDDGRGYRQSQSFDISGLQTGVPTCLVKRIDPRARRQVSRWLVGHRLAGEMIPKREEAAGRWMELTITVTPSLVRASRLRLTEEFVSGEPDVNCYRVEIYQP